MSQVRLLNFPNLPRLRIRNWRAWAAGALLIGVGSLELHLFASPNDAPKLMSPAVRSAAADIERKKPTSSLSELPSHGWYTAGQPKPSQPIVPASANMPAKQGTDVQPVPALPLQEPKPPEPLAMPTPSEPADQAAPLTNKLPISLDTVFRLAEEQNTQVSLAREKVNEAYAEKCLAQRKWLPDVYVGSAWYRHEGGIQLQEGPLVHSSTGAMFNGLEIDSRFDIREFTYQKVNAQRKLWQQKGELTRITTEMLLEAANTYIDMLAARTAEAIVREEQDKLAELLKQAKAAADDLLPQADILRIESEMDGQRQLLAKLQTQAAAAGAKLIYLLQLDPTCELVPVDQQLVPFDLIDPHLGVGELIDHALRNGPGVNEMEGLLATIHDAMARSKTTDLLPILEARMAEGVFGAGPGQSSVWDNRWDLGLQARWNLTPFLTRNDRLKAAQAKANQAHVAYQDLRGKLTAGVQEAFITSAGSQEQFERGATQIEKATKSYVLVSARRNDRPTRYPFTDVFLSISSLTRARLGYIAAVSEHDKAQVRLMVLLGPGASRAMGLERTPHGH